MEQEIGIEEIQGNEHIHLAAQRFLTPRSSPPTPRDESLLGQGTALELDCGLAATAWGEGPTVLLAHGWDSRRTHWGAFIPALVESGFRAVAVDAPAHGDSPGTKANALQYGLALAETGRQIGSLAGALGHSFGAAAVAIGLQRGLSAERAVLISGPSSLRAITERWCRHHKMAEADIPGFIRIIEAEVGEPFEVLDVARIASELRVPALVVHDRIDDDVPLEDALAIAAAWPGSRILITERFGHKRILIAREVVREVVAFFQEAAE